MFCDYDRLESTLFGIHFTIPHLNAPASTVVVLRRTKVLFLFILMGSRFSILGCIVLLLGSQIFVGQLFLFL